MRPSLAALVPLLVLFACDDKDTGSPPVDTGPDTTCPPPEEDADGDCYAPPEDCDDSNPYVNPGADEVPYDGLDNDCAGDGDLTDWDGDGYDGEAAGGDDCNDNNPEINPGAEETCNDVYNGIDADCDGSGQSDDCDGDGYDRWDDCADDNPDAYPGADEVWYDGVDGDCDMYSDYDADFDGQDHDEYGGQDCDDSDPDTWYGTVEIWDGADNDCDGYTDKMNQADAPVEYVGDSYYDADGYLGAQVAWTSDLDGDGYLDILASAPAAGKDSDGKYNMAGRMYVLPGSGGEDTAPMGANISFIEGETETYLTYWDGLDSLGDLDGDGYDEVGVGAPVYSISGNMGAALVYSGADFASSSELSTNDYHAVLYGGDYYGYEVTSMGDIDGDSLNEVITGSADLNTAALTVYSGAVVAAGGNVSSDMGEATISGTGYGARTLGGGDFDGDGLADIIAGMDAYTVNEDGTYTGKAGKAYAVSGADLVDGGTIRHSTLTPLQGSGTEGIGFRSGWTYDADGDGYVEVMLGAPFNDGTLDSGFQGGAIYVIPGPDVFAGGTPSSLATFTIQGDTEYGWCSPAMRPADFDGDGLGDMVASNVGSSYNDVKGHSYVFFDHEIAAGGTVTVSEASAMFATKYEDDRYGWGIDFADFDFDGDDDVLIGAGNTGAGYLWVFTYDM